MCYNAHELCIIAHINIVIKFYGRRKMAKVSIIIPTYNVEMYLVECMDSVVNQTLKDIEIICINDGSTDSSLEILKGYAEKDDRIIIVDKENGGYGIGMNIGLDKATGEYIGIVEPDDFVPLNMYEELYNKAVENDLDLVKADFYRFKRNDDNGNMTLVYNHLSPNAEDYNVVFNPSETPSAIRFIMNTWSGIYKRSFIEEYHIRHNETPGASFQDNGFWFQTFIYAKRAMIVNKPYYMNRRDNPNSSVHSREKVYCVNVEYDHIRDILVKDPEIWERFRGVYWLKKYHNYNETIRRIGPEFKKDYIRRYSSEFKRAMEMQEIDQTIFTKLEWANIQFIIKSPDDYYYTRIACTDRERKLEREVRRLRCLVHQTRADLDRVKKTPTFRIGAVIMFIPRKIKSLFSRNK